MPSADLEHGSLKSDQTSRSIFLVEDESLVAEDLKSLLENQGFDVLGHERSGQATLEFLEQNNPDIVLMDIQLEGDLNGIETAKQMDQQPPPVVFLTAHTDRKTLDEAAEANPLGYLTKPINEADLRTTLEVAIQRRETMLELQRVKNRYQTLVEANPDLVVLVNSRGIINYISDNVRELGYESSDLVGSHMSELFHAEDFQEHNRQDLLPEYLGLQTGDGDAPDLIDERRTGQRATERLEVRVEPGDEGLTGDYQREYPVYELNSSGLYGDSEGGQDPDLIGSIIVMRDITKRKTAEEELKLKERAMSTVHEGITIARCDEDGDPLIYVNEGFVQMTGYEKDDVLGEDCRFLQGEETSEETRAKIRQALDKEEFVSVEILNYRKNGEPFWNQLSITPIRDEHGETTHYVGIQQDVTDRKQREKELQLKERAMDSTQEGILLCKAGDGDDDPITFVNEGFLQITGYEREEVLGRDCRFLQGPETQEDRIDEIRDAIEQNEPVTTELINYTKEGEPFWNRLSITPVTDDRDNVTHYVGVQQDITEMREKENELRESEKLAAIGEMAAGLMHEINNPNAFIKGNIDFLEKGWERISESLDDIESEEVSYIFEEIDDTLDAVHKGTERIENIVNKVKLFSRRKSSPSDYKTFNPVPIIDSAIEMVESDNKEVLNFDPDEVSLTHEPLVKADPDELKQVVTNLVENALDAISNSKAPVVEIDLRTRENKLILSVADNGPGIPEDVKNKIFDPFFTTKETGKGTGLGLSIVKGIVERAGGEITVNSSSDGTEFQIALPLENA